MARTDLQNGPAHAQMPADRWRQRRRALGKAQGRAGWLLARPHAGEQAADAGDRRRGQQDCPHRLGLDD